VRKILIILCLGVMSLPASWLYAHPPEKVVLSYDQDAHSLTAEVVHPVSDPDIHFVNRIEVLLNGKMIIEKKPPRQNETMLSEVYSLTDVKSGDIVKVTSFCSWGGDQSEQIQIALADKS